VKTAHVRGQGKIVQAAVAAAAVALVASAPAPACGCGIALESSVPRERALIVHKDGRERLVMSFDLLAKGDRPAIVLPVPARPVVRAASDPFAYLESATRPRERVVERYGGGGDGATAGAPPVDVIDRKTIGGFDVTRIGGASDPGALTRWLNDHGYETPQRAEPILAEYAGDGWSFVAVRLPDGASGRLRPLSIAFASDRPIYPMKLDRLASSSVAVDLWFVAPGRVHVDGFEDRYAGSVAALRPAVPRRLSSLIGAGWVTRVGGTVQPYAIRGDAVGEAAATGGAFRAAVDRVEYTGTPPAVNWLEDHLLLVLLGAAAVVAALALGVRRLRR
jgi:hypothetical protein